MPTFYNVTSTGNDANALQVASGSEFLSKQELMKFVLHHRGDFTPVHALRLMERLNSTDTSAWTDPTWFVPNKAQGNPAVGSEASAPG